METAGLSGFVGDFTGCDDPLLHSWWLIARSFMMYLSVWVGMKVLGVSNVEILVRPNSHKAIVHKSLLPTKR